VEKIINLIQTMPIGNPLAPDTRFGPQVDQAQLDKCIEYTRYGQEDGATLRIGGHPIHPPGMNGKGFFFEPTIFTNAKNTMRIARDEIFGPILTVIPFETEAEAVALANDNDYGLAAGVHTLNLKRAHRVAHQLQAGICWVNTYNQFDVATPFGGYKASGIGRELGPEVMENYTQVKSVWVDLS